jgi:hypothetical protein
VVINAAPSQVTITATATQILCYGGTGSVTLTSNGGTGTLTYGTTATTSLTADTYNYTVTDANGCSANTDAVINAAPSQVTITATATQILCYGGTGSVALTSNGGTGTLTYGTTATTSLTADTYNYTVTDANGCSANTSAVINAAPSQVTVTATTSTNASCINATDGAIGLTVTGGTLAYTYLWSNNAVTKDITGLAIGNYSVTVTDHNGCTANANASVILYDVIKPVVITKNISIDLDATGNVTITASQVNNGSNDACGIASMTLDKSTFNCSNKGNNTVVLTVTDVNGNVEIGNATVTINDVTNPIALCKAVTKVLSNGMATIALSDIDNGSSDACGIASRTLSKTSFNCSNIGSNTVTLTVTDMNGNVSTCTSNVTITGSVPTISLTSAPNNANNVIGSTNTLAGVNQMFLGYGAQSMNLSCIGAGPLTYNWSGSGLNSNTIANPVFTPTTGGNKTLTCTVTNLNGCQTSSNIVICVMDIRSSGGSPSNPKVNICHLPPGNVANVQTLSVSISAVPAHIGLHGGDRLGACAQSCGSQKSGEIGEIYTDGNADLIVYPNPSASTFSFRLETSSNEPITINVFDINGRLVSNTEYSNASEMMLIGDNLANGMYFAQVKQGEFNKTVRIQKIY